MLNLASFAEEVAEILGLPKEEIKPLSLEEEQHLYTFGYHLYEHGDYKGAGQLFTKLVLSDPLTGKYWRGLASSKQMLKEYPAALRAWGVLALLEEQDPLPHFHAAECLLSMDEKQEALKALQAAESLTGSDNPLGDKIALLKQLRL